MPQQLLRIQEVVLAQLLRDRGGLPVLRGGRAWFDFLSAAQRRHRHALRVALVLVLVNDGFRRLPRVPTLRQGDRHVPVDVSFFILALHIVPDGLCLGLLLMLQHPPQGVLLCRLGAHAVARLTCRRGLVARVLGRRLVLVARRAVPLGLLLRLLVARWLSMLVRIDAAAFRILRLDRGLLYRSAT